MNSNIRRLSIPASLLILVSFSAAVFAHCDSMSGPVIADAQKAIEAGRPDAVLKWVRPQDEQEIRSQFEKTLSVRKLSAAAAELADRYFFETLVRLHRAGEGAAYTGLKDGGEVDPVVQKSDAAIAAGDIDPLIRAIQNVVEQGIRKRFKELKEKEPHKEHLVDAGRAYVSAYVEFVHYVEGLHTAATRTGHIESTPSEHEHSH